MTHILVQEKMPGLAGANFVEGKIKSLGVKDIQLFFDEEIRMWAVCQVMKRGGLLLPRTYMEEGVKPSILWWCKSNDGSFRSPNEQDIHDIVAVVTRAQTTFTHGGDALADEFERQDAEKDRKHRANFKKKIHDIAPDMKKALRKGNL